MCQKRRPRVLIADAGLRLAHIADAPQLAATCQLDTSIELAIFALLATHPELQGECAAPLLDGAEPAVCLADAIVLHGRALQMQLERYHQTFLAENTHCFE
jgi:hypothetical protein